MTSTLELLCKKRRDYMKKNENLKRMSKRQMNEMALEAATKTEEHIYYDYEYPLVINKDRKSVV